MKKLLSFFAFLTFAVGMSAQTSWEKNSYVGGISYQTEFQRFGLQAQGRYAFCSHLRLAPDVTFYFPKDQVTGLDMNLNLHYVFPLQKVSVYPLAGISLQTNFYANSQLDTHEGSLVIKNQTGSDFAFNVGGGATYPLSDQCFLNAEAKFMISAKHNFAVMIGIGRWF